MPSGTDARRDAQDQAYVLQFDRVGDIPARRDGRSGHAGHALADLDKRRLIVQCADLGAAENVDAPRFLQGADQNADAFAAGRQDQAAEAGLVVHAAEREIGQALGRDGAGRGHATRSLPLLANGGNRGVVKGISPACSWLPG